jgi:methylene-tetrahydromethanopterin dehydrogenase
MTKKNILHMISPQENVSPFDVNMACDAGYELIVPYTNVNLTDVKGLIQDAIFSRSVNNAKKTGVFICGKDASLALDMMDLARKSMVPPFEISVFPDPAGSFTTAAAMVACTEKTLKEKFKTDLNGKNIVIYGGKGIVGGISAIMCAQKGSKCTIVGYDGIKNVSKKAEEYKSRFGVDIIPGDGSTDELNSSYLPEAEIIFCAARAGTQVISMDQLKVAKKAMVLADVNAVPPAGLEGVGLKDDDTKHMCGALSIGPLTSGDVKVKTQYKMFEIMCSSDKPQYLNFDEALITARKILGL